MSQRSRAIRMFALSLMGSQAACFSLAPTFGATPRPGTQVALDINDAGRVALGAPVAPEIERIEGRLVSADSAAYVVGITDVHSIRGLDQPWTGEQVTISRNYVNTMYAQHFSVVRTTAFVAATAAVVAYVANKALEGFATSDNNGGTGGTTAQSIRIPALRRAHLFQRH